MMKELKQALQNIGLQLSDKPGKLGWLNLRVAGSESSRLQSVMVDGLICRQRNSMKFVGCMLQDDGGAADEIDW
eukprot:11263437-Karenia_brevis.AAC.1